MSKKKDIWEQITKSLESKLSKSEFNTSIPGQVGYKSVKFSDQMREHQKNVNEFFWLYKG